MALLAFNYFLGLFILLRYQKIDRPFDFKRDGVVFIVPIALHVYDIAITFALNIQVAYIPVLVVSAIHIGYFLYIYLKGKRLEAASLVQKPVQYGI